MQTVAGCAALLLFAGVFFMLNRRGHTLSSFFSLVAMMVIIFTAAKIFVLPEVSHFKSARELAFRMNHLLPPGEPVVFYRDLRESVVFYSGRRAEIIKTQEELTSFLNSQKTAFCIMNTRTLNKIKHDLRAPFFIVAQEGYFAIISNKKPSENTLKAMP
jgi:hypothetical protein